MTCTWGSTRAGGWRPGWPRSASCADVLLLAGDLTQVGQVDEAEVLVGELAEATVPVIAVLGNHDLHSDLGDEVVSVLEAGGVTMLEGGTAEVDGPRHVAGRGRRGRLRRRLPRAHGQRVRRAGDEGVRAPHRRVGEPAGARAVLARHRRARRPDALLPGRRHAGQGAARDLPLPRQLPAGRGRRPCRRRPGAPRTCAPRQRAGDDTGRRAGPQRRPARARRAVPPVRAR